MGSSRKPTTMIHGIRRAWAVVRPHERRRLQLVTLYGVLIAGLDTIALVLIYALINVLNDQPVAGIAGTLIDALGLSGSDRYRTALTLLLVTAALFVARSLLSVLGLWLTIGASNAAQADLVLASPHRSRTRTATAPARTEHSETLRTIMSSVDQVIGGVVSSSVSLVANVAVAVAVALGLILSSPVVALAVTIYFTLITVIWARAVRGTLARRGQRTQELHAERYRLVLQGLSAAKELQLRGRALFYAERRSTAPEESTRRCAALGSRTEACATCWRRPRHRGAVSRRGSESRQR